MLTHIFAAWRHWLGLLALVLIATTVIISTAQEGTDEAHDLDAAQLDADANACAEGGSMEGRCETEWDWIYGWYFIRYEAGIFTREELPEQYRPALPPVIVVDESGDTDAPTQSSVPATCSTSMVGVDLKATFDWDTPIAGQTSVRFEYVDQTGNPGAISVGVQPNFTVQTYQWTGNPNFQSLKAVLLDANNVQLKSATCH